jgi:(1->4)-alpha-D-glucan 1-alpha-D-glucosylmutase
MLATSTHDTKRSEDVRARLAVLSEIPDEWAAAVTGWIDRAAGHWRGGAADPHAAYVLFQTLVGAWPIGVDRAQAYMEKASREAKRRTSWTQQDAGYEAALRGYVAGVLGDPALAASIAAFARRIQDAGRQNSLTQLLLKLTLPGIPDIYQGTELWDLSLVDPDNRRPVDFAARRALLARLSGATPAEVLAGMEEGLPKLWLIRQALRLRAARPALFDADYAPLHAHGRHAGRLVAFRRGDDLVAVAPRWTMGLGGGWADTSIDLPPGGWRDELSGAERRGGRVGAAALLDGFPVALLARSAP